jgi:hypothetical protein
MDACCPLLVETLSYLKRLCSPRFFPVAKVENLHEFLPDPSPFGLSSFDLFHSPGFDRGSTLRPVQN